MSVREQKCDAAQAGVDRSANMFVPATSSGIWRRNQLAKAMPLLLAARRLVRR